MVLVPADDPDGAYNSRGSDFIGTVSSSDFVPGQFDGSMHLGREISSGKIWWGQNGNEESQLTEPATDTSDEPLRDDDPQSGGSAGKIYDLDGPELPAYYFLDANIIMRIRTNFDAWAHYTDDYNKIGGRPVRCPETMEWYTRQSYKLTGLVGSGTATGGSDSTLSDTNQSWSNNEWSPGVVWIIAGTGANQFRRVVGNTASVLSVESDWSIHPDAMSQYRIINTSTWTEINDIDDDNVNRHDAGTTQTSWDLQ